MARFIFVSISLLICLAACGKSDNTHSQSQTDTSESPAPDLGLSAEARGLTITITSRNSSPVKITRMVINNRIDVFGCDTAKNLDASVDRKSWAYSSLESAEGSDSDFHDANGQQVEPSPARGDQLVQEGIEKWRADALRTLNMGDTTTISPIYIDCGSKIVRLDVDTDQGSETFTW